MLLDRPIPKALFYSHVRQGDFELCKEISCSGQCSVHWLKKPTYSADGTQRRIGEFSNLEDEKTSAYIALVRVRNKP